MTIMKIAYITVQIPYGKGETFIIPEIKEVIRQGNTVLILPFRPEKNIFHRDAVELKEYTHKKHLFSAKVFSVFIIEILRRPVRGFKVITKMLSESGRLKIIFKNITTIPKGFYAASIFRREGVDHIHAHWASTPSSVAYIASSLTGISWSFTSHRWDITENNLLLLKVSSASFVRAIDRKGREEILELVSDPELNGKVEVIHMGVQIPHADQLIKKEKPLFTFIIPANFVEKKGHRYLFNACKLIAEEGLSYRCLVAGSGPLDEILHDQVGSLQLEKYITFLGIVPHDLLLQMYARGDVDLVVLPSIVDSSGEREGIPVALMEAMAHCIPVITTDTGGIRELVEEAGIIVPQKDDVYLSRAIKQMITEKKHYERYRQLGYLRIHDEFDTVKNVEKLVARMRAEVAHHTTSQVYSR